MSIMAWPRWSEDMFELSLELEPSALPLELPSLEPLEPEPLEPELEPFELEPQPLLGKSSCVPGSRLPVELAAGLASARSSGEVFVIAATSWSVLPLEVVNVVG